MDYPPISHPEWHIRADKFPFCAAHAEKLRFLLGYAILAPSAHNAQPWQCRIEDKTVLIFFDRNHDLPESDPTSRQAFLSLGAFVANLVISAEAFGGKTDTVWLPHISRNDCVAKITIDGQSNWGKTINQAQLDLITTRRVDRSIYTLRSLPTDLETRLRRIVTNSQHEIKVITDIKSRTRIAQTVAHGMAFAFKSQPFRRELSRHVVPNSSSQRFGIPGYTAGLNGLTSYLIPRLMWSFDIGKSQAKLELRRFASSPGIIVLGSLIDNPRSWLETGFVYQHVALELTRLGIVHAVSGAPVEAPTLPQKVQSIIGSEFRPMMVFRIGYSNRPASHSPRRTVSDILIA